MEQIYQYLYTSYPFSEASFFALGQTLANFIPYWVCWFYFSVIVKNTTLVKYKIQRNPLYDTPPKDLVIKAIIKSLVDQIIGFVAFYMIWSYNKELLGFKIDPESIPDLPTMLRQIFCFIVIEDTLFYWSHRLLHVGPFYRFIHKRHHEFKATISLSSEYAHPIEMIFSNILPSFVGPILFKAHVVVFWIFLAIRVTESQWAHSGYNLPFSPFHLFFFQGGEERHDFHHTHNVGSFGSWFCFWDWICGTDRAFRKWKRLVAEGKFMSQFETNSKRDELLQHVRNKKKEDERLSDEKTKVNGTKEKKEKEN